MAKTSKKQNKKIDGKEHLLALERTNELKAAVNADNLFVEDKEGGLKGVAKALRQKIAVMDKKGRVPISPGEQLLVKKLIEKKDLSKTQPKPAAPSKPALFDAWGAAPVSRRKRRDLIERFVPSVVLPHAGQSVNPTPEAFVELVSSVAEELTKHQRNQKTDSTTSEQTTDSNPTPLSSADSEAVLGLKKLPVRKTIADRNREARHKKLMASHDIARVEKKLEKQLNHLGSITKQISTTEQIHQQSEEQRLNRKEQDIVNASKGVVKVKGAGGIFHEAPIAISLTSGSSLRTIRPAVNPVSDRMEAIMRQRLTVQKPQINGEYFNKIKQSKKNKTRFHKFQDANARDIALLR